MDFQFIATMDSGVLKFCGHCKNVSVESGSFTAVFPVWINMFLLLLLGVIDGIQNQVILCICVNYL